MLKGKKAQAWYMDLIFGAIIFIAVMLIFFRFEAGIMQDGGTYDDMVLDSKLVSEQLLSEGYPLNWTKDNVKEIGLLTDERIDADKFQSFRDVIDDNYARSRMLLGTHFDYYIFLQDKNETMVFDAGKPGITKQNVLEQENPKNLIKTVRLVVYEHEAMQLVLYLWADG